jgi:ATP-dependent DNA helicase RecG
MMKTTEQIESLLARLDHCIADDLEDQDLDFKQWNQQSRDKAVKTVVQMAVCMANGGGGTVVFGVAEHIKGRNKAILGIPPEIDANLLKKAVYDQTDPKITPVFEELRVVEGTGRLLIMRIYPGLPPYTDSAGRGTIRVGKDCQPLTGTLRRKISVETGESDYTAELVAKIDSRLLSATALESLRNQAGKEQAPEDLLRLTDADLLSTLGLVKHGKLTRAALLLAGTEAAIREHLSGYNWTFLQMLSDSNYGIREDRASALTLSIQRIEELLRSFNPITTYQDGLFHYEYRVWPEIAVREALMNAFSHAELRIAGPIMVKLYTDRLEISNNGGFIAGITPHNILHHQPAARNPLLVDALTRLRLVNRTNLGISRMFSAFLMEGKEPPIIRESGESITLIFLRCELNTAFRLFVAKESSLGRYIGVDILLILRYLLKQPGLDLATAASLCQRREPEVQATLVELERRGYIEQCGAEHGLYWCIHPDIYNQLVEDGGGDPHHRIDWETAKTQVLSILMERARRGESGLGNKEIRQITRFDRNKARRLIQELMQENTALQQMGKRRWVRYEYIYAQQN